MSGREGDAIAREIGARLRAVRQSRQLSLDAVEEKSGGRWTAGIVGSYERATRNMSVLSLYELAGFYGVRLSALLPPEIPAPGIAVGDVAAVGRALRSLQDAYPRLAAAVETQLRAVPDNTEAVPA